MSLLFSPTAWRHRRIRTRLLPGIRQHLHQNRIAEQTEGTHDHNVFWTVFEGCATNAVFACALFRGLAAWETVEVVVIFVEVRDAEEGALLEHLFGKRTG